jgi:hypothetical protein
MADVEQGWFRQVMAGQKVTEHFESKENRDAAWDDAVATQECVDEAWRLWREEVAFAEKFVDEAPDLDVVSAKDDAWRGPMSLRWDPGAHDRGVRPPQRPCRLSPRTH